MHILGTGLTGLIGSRIVELLSPEIIFTDLSRSSGIDITDTIAVENFVKEKNPDLILHLAAMTNVDGAEKEKDLGEESESWKVNVKGTKNVVNAAENIGKGIMYISTDFIFDGESPQDTGYTEEDTPNPINWYGETKYEGELVVKQARTQWTIIRISSPYRATHEKKDFMRAILSRLESGEEIQGVDDRWITPTYIDDIAEGIKILVQNDATGIYHCVGSTFITPYDVAKEIARVFEKEEMSIKPVSASVFLQNRAKRPFKSILNNAKMKKLGLHPSTFREGLEKIKQQL
jgi:dTDP-4-dehydrorhamnose reductase